MDLAPLTAADERLVDAAVDASRDAFSPPEEGRFEDAAHRDGRRRNQRRRRLHGRQPPRERRPRLHLRRTRSARKRAVADGDHSFDRVVAVEHPRGDDESFHVIPPCGVCRELLADYGDDIRVVVRTEEGDVGAVPVADLLPARTW